MSSGFVSGGTTDAPIERDDAWRAAQEEVEAKQRRKAEEAQQPPAKSLYEVLQANNAAKEDAFAEAAKLKNQFRALNEDEAEFLDSVLESTRAEEERVRRETAEGLEAFRTQQEEADRKLRTAKAEGEPSTLGETRADDEEMWTAAGPRKRKRTKEKEGFRGLKLRKASTSEGEQTRGRQPVQKDAELKDGKANATLANKALLDSTSKRSPPVSSTKEAEAETSNPTKSKNGLGLVDYGSDEDDD